MMMMLMMTMRTVTIKMTMTMKIMILVKKLTMTMIDWTNQLKKRLEGFWKRTGHLSTRFPCAKINSMLFITIFITNKSEVCSPYFTVEIVAALVVMKTGL